MQATRAKQLLKNGIYRAIGETVAGTGALDGEGGRTLRALMYHKVNDIPGNPVTVPTSLFDEQMAQLRELGYRVVDLDAVIDHYVQGKPLPGGATLITFDDGYRDNLENALPVLRKHGYPAVLFVPIGFLGENRPLPHEERLTLQGIRNRTMDWGELRELEAEGVRIECHGISHRPVADLALDEAAREIVVTSVSGANGPRSDRFRLRRYNVEPYPARTFELVLRGACDLIALKDTVAGTYARRAFNAALGTSSK